MIFTGSIPTVSHSEPSGYPVGAASGSGAGSGSAASAASRSARARSTSARGTSGVVMTSWIASSTSSQPLATVFRMDFHSFNPSRP